MLRTHEYAYEEGNSKVCVWGNHKIPLSKTHTGFLKLPDGPLEVIYLL